jgi:hypothetical protein
LKNESDYFLYNNNNKPEALSRPYYKNDFDNDIRIHSHYNLSDLNWNQSENTHHFKNMYSQTNITFKP